MTAFGLGLGRAVLRGGHLRGAIAQERRVDGAREIHARHRLGGGGPALAEHGSSRCWPSHARPRCRFLLPCSAWWWPACCSAACIASSASRVLRSKSAEALGIALAQRGLVPLERRRRSSTEGWRRLGASARSSAGSPRREGRPMLVDFGASWCTAWQRARQAHLPPSPDVAAEMAHFVNGTCRCPDRR